jgi:hypothetical protein
LDDEKFVGDVLRETDSLPMESRVSEFFRILWEKNEADAAALPRDD